MLRFQIEFATSRLVAERGYYPYGLPFGQHQDWTATDRNTIAPGLPGFTGQEGADLESWETMFQNFGARYYDSQIGRWHAPDPAWQFPSPYAYGSVPNMGADPNGEFFTTILAGLTGQFWLLPATIYFDFFTETGYDLQKYTLPLAVNVDVKLGTHQKGLGLNVSAGIPQIAPFSVRGHAGATYYWKNYGVTPGWEGRYGGEVGFFGVFNLGTTYYDSPGSKFDQRIGHATIGVPGLNIKYANDWFPLLPLGDGGDRYRTAALKLQIGPIDIGFNLFTGDPGMKFRERQVIDNELTYVYNPRTGDDPDEFRFGVGYIGIGPFRFGNDTEARRHFIQNKVVHEHIGSAYFKVLDQKRRFYFQFSTSGNSIW